MKTRFLLPLFLLLAYAHCSAQLMDSLYTHFEKKPQLVGKLDSRNTFINGKISEFTGVKGGIGFNNRFRFGLGFSYLKNGSSELFAVRQDTSFLYNTVGTNKIRYYHAFVEYVFYRQGRWEFSLPVQAGVGNAYVQYKDPLGVTFKKSQHIVVLYEPSLSGHYKIFKWFAVGMDLGFRYAIIRNKELGNEFQSPTYTFKTMIFWEQLYKQFFPNTRLAKKL